MNKRFLFILICAASLIIPLQQRASALGIGVYGGYSYSEPEVEHLEHSSINYTQIHQWWGGGLVFDTAVAKKKLFNFRLNLGLGQLTQEPESGSAYSHKGLQVDLITSYGFGIVKVSFLRMWLGPQLGLRMSYIDFKHSNLEEYRLSLLPGAVLGFNFNIGSFFTIGIDGGFRYNLGLNFIGQSGDLIDQEIFSAMGPEGFVNLSIMFRFGDKMKRKPKKEEPEPEAREEEKRSETTEKSEKPKDDKINDKEDYWFGD